MSRTSKTRFPTGNHRLRSGSLKSGPTSARVVAIATAVLLQFGALSAEAGSCSGFADIDDTSPFCAGVSWMKNRGITLGCSSNLYCPGGSVTRVQMAAFMSRLDRVLPPTVVDSAGKALGSFAALDGSLIYPAVGYLIRRTGDEIYRVPLHYVSPGKMRFSDWVFLYYELPGCSGRMFISATPSAYRTAAAVVPSADGMLGLYASAPNVSASSITTLAVRGPDGTCTVGLSTGMLMEVGLVEDLGYHYDDVFELR